MKGEITASLYDHLLVRNEAASAELIANAKVIDLRGEVATPVSFYQTVSDHLPIAAEFRVSRPDDD